MIEHSPYYLKEDTSAGLGIKKIRQIVSEKNARIYEASQSARDLWKDSGVTVREGEYVQIQAKGFWGCQVEHLGYHGPDGDRLDKEERFPWCALLGKISFQGEPFLVGSICTFHTTRTGNLFFIMNDGVDCYDNNRGKVDIKIAVLNQDTALQEIDSSSGDSKEAPSSVQPERKEEKKVQKGPEIECSLRMVHLKSGEIHGQSSAGCHGTEKIDEMISFLARKLHENTRVRKEPVAVVSFREIGEFAQTHGWGKTMSRKVWEALGRIRFVEMIPEERLNAMLSQKGIDPEAIARKPGGIELEGISYVIVGEIEAK